MSDDSTFSQDYWSDRAIAAGWHPGMTGEQFAALQDPNERSLFEHIHPHEDDPPKQRFADVPAYPEGFDPDHRTNDNLPEPPPEPVLVTAPDLRMQDAEALSIIRHIRRSFEQVKAFAANTKRKKAQEASDLRDYLLNHERLDRLAGWRASCVFGQRRSVTTPEGTLGCTTVKAHCVVEDAGIALPWLEQHHPEAIEKRIVPDKLPAPKSAYNGDGEIVWTAPGPGLLAVPEREELTVDGRRIDVFLRAGKEGESDE